MSNKALIDGAVKTLWRTPVYCVCLHQHAGCTSILLHVFFMYTKTSSEAPQGSWAHIHTTLSIFCVRKIFLFNAAVQLFLPCSVWIRVRRRVTWSWQQRRLLLRDLCIFLFSYCFSLYCRCYWPFVDIGVFKRHFISLSCSYSRGKGGKSCTVFLFYLPLSLDLQMNSGQAFIFPPYAFFSCPTTFLLSCGNYSSRLKVPTY